MTGPYYSDADVTLWHGECVQVMRGMDDNSVHAIVTDPPYDLTAGNGTGGFMGKKWDSTGVAFDPATWAEALRVLRPGGHMLAFGGTRTFHRLTCAIEDAGFEIRDSIASYGGTIPGPFATLSWVQGQGFPKSRNVSKDIDREAGAEREPSGAPTSLACEFVRRGIPCEGHGDGIETSQSGATIHALPTAPATDAARQWDGWGTALRPSHEPIVVARKPLTGIVAQNVMRWGTGAVNVDGCRVAASDTFGGGAAGSSGFVTGYERGSGFVTSGAGRWPSNVVLTHSESCTDRCVDGCPVKELDQQSGVSQSPATPVTQGARAAGSGWDRACNDTHDGKGVGYADTGGSSRFFPTFRYEPKAPTLERPSYVKDGAGDHRAGGNFAGGIRVCQVCNNRTKPGGSWIPGDERPWPACGHEQWEWGTPIEQTGRVAHPTTKPLSLMRWPCRLVCPPDGTILDPFAGSGTTLEAALLEGFHSVGIEQDADYLPLIAERIRRGKARGHQADLFGGAA